MNDYSILENVYISSNGIILDSNKNILKLSRLHDVVYTDKFGYSSVVELDNEYDYVDLTHYYSLWPFAHRYDCLCKLRHVQDLINDNTQYLVGSTATINRFSPGRYNEEMNLFSVKNRIYHPNNETLFKVKKLIYPHWLFGEAPCAFSNESLIYCRDKYKSYFVDSGEKEYKLFLTRTNVCRDILNPNLVHNFFTDMGFIIINGVENLSDIINYFYNAEIIVGIHGGCFSNMIFCNKNKLKKVVEIFPSNMYNGCFVGWNQHLQVDYKTLTIESDKRNNIFFNINNLNEVKDKYEH